MANTYGKTNGGAIKLLKSPRKMKDITPIGISTSEMGLINGAKQPDQSAF